MPTSTTSRSAESPVAGATPHELSLHALAVEQAGIAVLVIDAAGRICAYNTEAERQLGVPRERMLTLQDVQHLPVTGADGAPVPFAEMPLVRAFRGESIRYAQLLRAMPDGGQRVLGVVATPLIRPDGTQAGAALYMRDVTDQQRVELERRRLLVEVEESRRRYRLIAQNYPDGAVFLFDKDLRYLVADGKVLETFGMSREMFEGRTLHEALPPDVVARVEAHYRRALAGESCSYESTRDGRVFTVRFDPVRGDDGAIVGGLVTALDITERAAAEAQARRYEQQMRRILESSMMAILFSTIDGKVQEPNDTFLRMLGYTRAEADAGLLDWRALTPPEWQSVSNEAVASLERDGFVAPFEKEYLRKDGTRIPVLLASTRIPEQGQNVTFILDITGRKVAEEELRAQKEELRRQAETLQILNDAGRQLSSELDLDKLVQSVTDAATKLVRAQFGAFFYHVVDDAGEALTLYSLSGASRESFAKFPLPRNTKVFAPTFSGETIVRSANIKKDPRYGHSAPHHGMPAGHLPVTSYLAVPVVSRAGKVLGGLFFGHEDEGVFTENAEQLVVGLAATAAVAMDNAALYKSEQRAAAAAEFERQRLRNLLSQLPAGVAVSWGAEHRFDWANGIYAEVAARDVAGKTVREAFPELTDQPFFDMLDGVYRNGKPVFGKEQAVHLHRKSATEKELAYFDFVYQPILDLAGRPEGILTFCIEVTEPVIGRRRVEALAADLSRAVADERRAVVQRDDVISQLEKTNRDLDQFAYVASHDLKAPLRGIANLSQWIEEDLAAVITPEAKAQMDLLRGRVHRLESLIDGILDYSRAGRARDRPEPVDLAPLCREVWETLAPPAGARLVTADPLPELCTERVQLLQVVQNLLSNAVKHAGPTPTVTVSAEDRGDRWEISVSDDGPGIAPEFRERVWGIFQTLAPRDRVESTGIGLSVVRKIVESHGGRTWIEGGSAGGASLRFTWLKTSQD